MKKFWLLFGLALLFPFQNCSNSGASSYAMLNSSSVQNVNCSLNPQSCLNTGSGTANLLSLRLNSWVTQNVSSTSTGLTLTGICNSGGFVRSRIYWQLVTSSGAVVTTSLLKGSQDECTSNGTFQELITGFVSSSGVALFTPGTQLAVNLILNGINNQGTLISPANTAQSTATQLINITQ